MLLVFLSVGRVISEIRFLGIDTHGRAAQLEAKGAGDESVHNGVGDGLVCEGAIPHTDRKLCGDGDCLFLRPPFIYNFIQVQTGQRLQSRELRSKQA